jgi:hypothetical protein
MVDLANGFAVGGPQLDFNELIGVVLDFEVNVAIWVENSISGIGTIVAAADYATAEIAEELVHETRKVSDVRTHDAESDDIPQVRHKTHKVSALDTFLHIHRVFDAAIATEGAELRDQPTDPC